ncbi:hypothetical protein DFH07DRAFT_1058426 [Mycena maculata]|uniref:DUF6532 domain-containing protein n=1 Tax=Mycena maculata TaxID=230809 RepID=A0AAD7NMG4_9AGAR|nr:hypothetical protein DFH07DRAFT_1058426 [Mycena maculata]
MPSNGWLLSPLISRRALARSPPRPLQVCIFNILKLSVVPFHRAANHRQAIQAISLVCAKSPKKKAGVVEQDTRGPIEDDFAAIAIVTVTTTAMKTSIVRGRSRSPQILYRFKTGQNKKTVARIRKIAEDLKEKSTFAFKEKTGLYKNTIFQMAVNAMWFAKCKDDGPHLPDLFGPRLRFGCT